MCIRDRAETIKTSAPSAAENQATAEDIETALEQKPEYVFPPLSLLVRGKQNNGGNTDEQLRQTAAKLKSTLESFGVKVQITNVSLSLIHISLTIKAIGLVIKTAEQDFTDHSKAVSYTHLC